MPRVAHSMLAALAAALFTSAVIAQPAPDAHAQHHPSTATAATSAPATAPPSTSTQPAMGGRMGAMMDQMMKSMGAPAPRDLYPSVMAVPEMSVEEGAELARRAAQRMEEGKALIAAGSRVIAGPAHTAAAMEEAQEQIRRGLTLYESGVAAQRSLRSGAQPRVAALGWFKREMNLLPAEPAAPPHGLFGLSWLHYVAMFAITAFAAATISMYFHKMKRAEVLLQRLAGGQTLATNAPISAGPPPARVAAAEALATAVARDIAPSRPNSWSGTLRVARIFPETPSVKTFRLVDPAGGKLPFTYLPGQFITVTVFPDGLPAKRSYTIASAPTNRDACEITVKHEQPGVVSGYLHDRVHEGELLQMTGPSGRFTFTGEEAPDVVLIAGGVGVTPMMSVTRYLTDRSWPGTIDFIYASRSEDEIIFAEELAYLGRRHPRLRVTLVASNANAETWPHRTGRITKELIAEVVPEIARRRVHLCGPPAMMDAVKAILAELGVPGENVHTEIFAAKPVSSGVAAAIDRPAPATTAVVTFARSKKTAALSPTKTILEASEDVGVNIDYSCRVGTCGICITKLLSGSVTMDVEDALTPEDKARQMILACQARAVTDVSVDA